jgi:uncharacterized protein DUF4190
MTYPPEDSPSREPYQERPEYQQPQYQQPQYQQPQYQQPQYQQPQYQQPQYQYQPAYQQPVTSGRTNTMAILSLVLAFVFWPLGIVFGHMARRQIRQTGEGGSGLATTGLVLGYLFGVLTLIGCAAWIALITYASSHPGVLPTPTP